MNKSFEVILPKLGESIVDATVIQWFKKEGDFVEKDEALLEVSTDKVNSEIPSPETGYLSKIVVHENQVAKVGEVLAILKTEKIEEKPKVQKEDNDFYSPSVLQFAKEKGLSKEELKKIPRKNDNNRLTKKDVEVFLSENVDKRLERIKMSHMRKKIADNMVKSFYEAPHASLISEVDVTEIVDFIKKEKEEFFQKNQCKLTVTSFIAKAITEGLKEFPLLNSSLEHDTIVMKHFVNLGFAVNVKNGLQVPVIKHCESLSVFEIAKKISVLANKARENKLQNEDIEKGTITLTNFGMTGTLIGIPIIRFSEVAIIGVGAFGKKVVVLENDTTAIRSIVCISLTFDHRVIDGIYGCGFLASVKNYLENNAGKFKNS